MRGIKLYLEQLIGDEKMDDTLITQQDNNTDASDADKKRDELIEYFKSLTYEQRMRFYDFCDRELEKQRLRKLARAKRSKRVVIIIEDD